jgi:transcriptional regulator with PAS, ATPase and Fis domain
MMPVTARPEDGLLLLGDSGAMAALRHEIASAATTHAKVMLLGETGVGKEVVARLIHAASPRAGQPFIAVNCSGIPETLLESELFGHVRGSFTGAFRDKPGLVQLAHRGTLFLDELGEMSLRMQAVLLRFAESGEVQSIGAGGPVERVDVRLITATNCDLAKQVEAGAFRRDLYYRLNVIRIEIPPLRTRDRDMVLLLTHFLRQASAAHDRPCPELTAGASEAIAQYAWPGNIREVKNVAERLVVRQSGATVGVENLPAEIRSSIRMPGPTPHPPAAGRGDRLPASALPGSHVANRLFAQLRSGENFWSVVYQPFKAHDLMRADVIALVDRGLRETSGSYRGLLALFNLAPADYKRFLAFLYQYECNLPVLHYRRPKTAASDPGFEAAS